MDSSPITAKFIENFLKAWVSGAEKTSDFADQPDFALRGDWLVEFMRVRMAEALRDEREAAGLTTDLVGGSWQKALQQDFQSERADLKALSALYFAYFHPVARGKRLITLAEVIPFSSRQYLRYLNQGYAWLAAEAAEAERRLQIKKRAAKSQFIPEPEYKSLFGVEQLVRRTTDALRADLAEGGAAMVSLEGLGGIGKTAVARQVASGFLDDLHLAGICWVSAKQEWINAQGELKALLKPDRTTNDILLRLAEQMGVKRAAADERLAELRALLLADPYLIVVDNLETIEDPQALLPVLSSIRGRSRFLLTSRFKLSDYPSVQSIPVLELSLENSLSLLRDELHRLAASGLDDGQMGEIYALTGGMPLILKLVAAQLSTIPYANILSGLRAADRRTPENLYTYIYGQTWRLLDEPARALLVSMVDSAPEGETLDWLAMMSGLSEPVFEGAIRQLQSFRLVEKTGLLERPLYHIHRITSTFLSSQIHFRWDAP